MLKETVSAAYDFLCILPALVIIAAFAIKMLERRGHDVYYAKRFIRIPLLIVLMLSLVWCVGGGLYISFLGLEESSHETIRGLVLYNGIPLPVEFSLDMVWFFIAFAMLVGGGLAAKHGIREIWHQFGVTFRQAEYRELEKKLMAWDEFQKKYKEAVQEGHENMLGELMEMIVLCNHCGKGIRVRSAHRQNNSMACPYCGQKWILERDSTEGQIS